MLKQGIRYLDKQMKEDIERETKMETPTEDMLHYLYICALMDDKPDADTQKMRRQLMEFVRGRKLDLTIYGKAACAVIMAHDGQKSKAHDYLRSLREYAVTSPERGMYFDTPRAQYTWCDATIPTVTMAIEALRLVEPEDTVSVELMRRWLLSQRRTKGWGRRCLQNWLLAVRRQPSRSMESHYSMRLRQREWGMSKWWWLMR